MCWTDDVIPLVYLTDRDESGATHPPGGVARCQRLDTVVDVARGIYYVTKILKYARGLGGPVVVPLSSSSSPVTTTTTETTTVVPPFELLQDEHDHDAQEHGDDDG